MAAFRNAIDDDVTENATDTYLFGQFGDDDATKTYIYWTGVAGYRKVILRKVASGTHESLKGAVFTVHKGTSDAAYVLTHRDKTKETLSGLRSSGSGVIWIGELPYGTYFLEETTAPSGYSKGWFYLIVDDSGIYESEEQYSTRVLAKAAADAKNAEIKAAKAGSGTTSNG